MLSRAINARLKQLQLSRRAFTSAKAPENIEESVETAAPKRMRPQKVKEWTLPSARPHVDKLFSDFVQKYAISQHSLKELKLILIAFLCGQATDTFDVTKLPFVTISFPDKRAKKMLSEMAQILANDLNCEFMSVNELAIAKTLKEMQSETKRPSEPLKKTAKSLTRFFFDGVPGAVVAQPVPKVENVGEETIGGSIACSEIDAIKSLLERMEKSSKPIILLLSDISYMDDEFEADIRSLVFDWNRNSANCKLVAIAIKDEQNRAATPKIEVPKGFAMPLQLVKQILENVPSNEDHEFGLGGVHISVNADEKSPSFAALSEQLSADNEEHIGKSNLEAICSKLEDNSKSIEVLDLKVLCHRRFNDDEIGKIALLFQGAKIWHGDLDDRAALKLSLEVFWDSQHRNEPHAQKDPNKLKRKPFDVSSLSEHEASLMHSVVSPESIKVGFDDIGALSGVKQTLKELISLPLQFPEVFSKGILRETVSGILLFGPPGTGKSMIAKAVAAESGASFLSVTCGSLIDKYVGESEKNVKALFSLGRKLKPCVIFIDEIDALMGNRGTSTSSSHRVDHLNEFMAEWDGVTSRNEGLIVMGATNRPFALDDAVLRRLTRRILVDLPDCDARLEILQKILKDENTQGIDLKALAQRTESYSGSDLKNLCIAAAMGSVRRMLKEPSTESIRTIKQEDIDVALSTIHAVANDDMESLSALRKWDATFGEGKRKKALKLGFNQ